MFIKFPKDDKYFRWTRHIKNKMIFYALSEARIKSIFKNPQRKEEGIAPNTVAVMKVSKEGKGAAPYKRGEPRPFRRNGREEIWLMYKNQKSEVRSQKSETKIIMISAWRYPGVSKPGKAIPIPDDILQELEAEFDLI